METPTNNSKLLSYRRVYDITKHIHMLWLSSVNHSIDWFLWEKSKDNPIEISWENLAGFRWRFSLKPTHWNIYVKQVKAIDVAPKLRWNQEQRHLCVVDDGESRDAQEPYRLLSMRRRKGSSPGIGIFGSLDHWIIDHWSFFGSWIQELDHFNFWIEMWQLRCDKNNSMFQLNLRPDLDQVLTLVYFKYLWVIFCSFPWGMVIYPLAN